VLAAKIRFGGTDGSGTRTRVTQRVFGLRGRSMARRTHKWSRCRKGNAYLERWLRKKFKRLRALKRALACWRRITRQQPNAFTHWAWVPISW
jgi:hypothetical protein